MISRLLPSTALVALVTVTAACGGGGSTTPPPATPTPTSTFTKSLGCSHTFSSARLPAAFARVGSFGLRGPAREAETIATGAFAVRFAQGQVSPQASAILSRLGAVRVSAPNEQGAATFSLPASADPREAAAQLGGAPGVIAAGPLIYRHLEALQPNDPQFANGAISEGSAKTNQWDLYVIQMPAAWAVTTGMAKVKIAVIDTGYDTGNPDLIGKVDSSIVYATDPANGIEDKDGHGTDVSGIAAADTNNATDVAGVGWNVHLLEARVFPDGTSPGASTKDIASAINWAVAAGAKIINLSLGSSTPDPTYEEPAVAAAIAKGVIVVAAAGNGGLNTIDYPAADPGVIAVGASAYCDSTINVQSGYEYVATYSNYGAGLSLVAPGGDPTTAQTKCTTNACIDYLQWIENLDSLQGPFKEQIGLFAGTSQASPHVAGAVALMVSKDATLTPAAALAILRSSADKIGDPREGAGRLNVVNALNATP